MLGFLILFPLVVAGVLLVVRNNRARNVIVGASALVIGLASVWLVVSYLGAPWITYDFYSPVVDYVCMAAVSYTHLDVYKRQGRKRQGCR